MNAIFGFQRPFIVLVAINLGICCARGDITGFSKTDPVHSYAEMKMASSDGSIWRKPQEDWVGAQRRVATDPAWARWAEKQKSEVKAWMTQRRDSVKWVAGWGHDFVSPKDGSYLTYTPAVPGVDEKFLSRATDPHVEITRNIFQSWVMNFRGEHVWTIRRAALLWRLTGDPQYAQWVAGQLDFYAQNFEQWPLQNTIFGPSRLSGQSLDEACNLMQLTESARLIWTWATPARRQCWFEKLFKPDAELLNEGTHRIHNIACWMRSATAQVALLYGDEALWHEAVDGIWGLRQQLAQGVTSDYVWYEQSLGYNEWTAQSLIPFFIVAAMQGRGPQLAREMAITENLILAPTWLRFPNGTLPNPSDNTIPRRAPLTNTLLAAYRVLPTPIGLVEARKTYNWDTLIDPPSGSPAELPSLPAVTSRNFESTRFAILRAGGWQVFFHYGQLTDSHAHAEALNFEASYNGTDITHKPCTVGYGSPLHDEYFTRGLSHNVPLINGEGELPPQRGDLLAFDVAKATVAAAQPAYRKDPYRGCPDACASRRLHISGDRLIDETKITVLDDVPQKLGLVLNVQGRVTLPAQFLPVMDFATGRSAAFRCWRDVRSAVCHDHASFDLAYPDGLVLHVTFTVPGEFWVFHGFAPDTPAPARREAFYLETRGVEAAFITEFVPGTNVEAKIGAPQQTDTNSDAN